MKALQITGQGAYTIVDVDVPTIKADQVLVEIEMVSTCPRWDINMIAGKDMFSQSKQPDYPLPAGFPGHEAVGIVRAVGSRVENLKIGDRVAALEHIPGNGAYAQYLDYKENELLKIPEALPPKKAVSFELLKCVLIGLSQFGDIRGKSMLISGLGPAGILAMQLAEIWGASSVVGVDISEKRITCAKQIGNLNVLHSHELQHQQFDLGFDCVGVDSSVQKLLEIVQEHVVIFGVLRGSVSFKEQFWLKGLKLEAYKFRAFTESDRDQLLDAVMNKGLNTECLQTHHMSFFHYQDAIQLLQQQDALKVYFCPQQDFEKKQEGQI